MEEVQRVALISKYRSDVIQHLIEYFKPDMAVLNIAVTGSRAKLMYSKDSDYDVKVIFACKLDDYLLQRTLKHKNIQISLWIDNEELTIEGQGIDVNSAFEMSYNSNSFVSEFLRGFHIYSHPEFSITNLLQDSFTKFYRREVSVYQTHGLFIAEVKKVLKSKKDRKSYLESGEAKIVCEINYLIISLIMLLNFPESWFENYSIDKILDFLNDHLTTEKDIKYLDFCRKTLEARISNKRCQIKIEDFLKERITDIDERTNISLEILRNETKAKKEIEGEKSTEEYESFIVKSVINLQK